jgi:hypothetical protein
MGMRLVNAAGDWVQLTNMAIDRVRRLAHTYDGPVLTPATRQLSAETARQLADALARALPDIPDHDATAPKRVYFAEPVGPFAWDVPWEMLSDAEFFSGERKAELRECIALCRTGAVVLE